MPPLKSETPGLQRDDWSEIMICLGILAVVSFLALIAFFPQEMAGLLVGLGEWGVRVLTDNGGYWPAR